MVITGHDATFSQLADKKVTRVLSNPATFDLHAFNLKLDSDDVVLVADHEEASLKVTLVALRDQKVRVPIVAFTSLATSQLARQFPGVEFKNDKRLYRNEVKEVLRKAQTISRVTALKRLVQEQPALVVIWGNPDPDAIGSAYALRELINTDAEEFIISYCGEFTRPENQAMAEVIGIPMQKFQEKMIGEKTVVLTVDAQPSFFKENGAIRFDAVIDHHPLGELGDHAFTDIRPDYGSTCSILTEYYVACRKKIHRKIATALLYGLKTDTNNLTRNVSDADVEAFQVLRPLADENMLRTIELTQFPQEVLDSFSDAIRNRRIFGDVLFSYLGDQENPDICVMTADFLIRAKGVAWAITAARTDEKLIVVFRCTGFHTHAGEVAEALFSEFGTAGGHRTMARAEIERSAVADGDTQDWLLRRLAKKLRSVRSALAK